MQSLVLLATENSFLLWSFSEVQVQQGEKTVLLVCFIEKESKVQKIIFE